MKDPYDSRLVESFVEFPFPDGRFPENLGVIVADTVMRGDLPVRYVAHTPDNDWWISHGCGRISPRAHEPSARSRSSNPGACVTPGRPGGRQRRDRRCLANRAIRLGNRRLGPMPLAWASVRECPLDRSQEHVPAVQQTAAEAR